MALALQPSPTTPSPRPTDTHHPPEQPPRYLQLALAQRAAVDVGARSAVDGHRDLDQQDVEDPSLVGVEVGEQRLLGGLRRLARGGGTRTSPATREDRA